MKVLCRVLQADEVEQEITQRDQFNTDEVNLVATLIRESHQNSVDAKAESNNGPVQTAIRIVEPIAKNRQYFEALFRDLRPHLEASRIDIADIDFGMPRLLVIEDFGTTGLTGDFTQKSDHGPFNNFWRRIGRSEKAGGKGGRWGLGKLVFSSSSRVQTFFGLTIREDDPGKQWLMGQAVLATRRVDDKDYAPHVFLAEAGDGGLQLPTGDPTKITAFEAATSIARNGRPGLSIAIPFARDEITVDKLVPEVLRNYFFPILTERLTVTVGEELIDASTFDRVAAQHKWSDSASSIQVVKFIREIKASQGLSPDVYLDSRWTTDMERSLPTAQLEALRTKLAIDGQMVCVRAPVALKHKTKGALTTHVDLYLKRTTDQSKGSALYVRGQITVPDEARYFTPRQTLAALVASDGPVVSFLGDAENPAHTRWNGKAEKLRNWSNAAARLSEIRNSLAKLQAMLLQAVESVEKEALRDLFSLEDEAATPSKNPKPTPPKPPPPVPPLPPSQPLFTISDSDGGFTIRSTKAASNAEYPLTIKIRVAYDVLRGDPFKKFSEHDFQLGKKGVDLIAGEGLSARAVSANEMEVECSSYPFSLKCTGFDSRRDIVVVAKRSAA